MGGSTEIYGRVHAPLSEYRDGVRHDGELFVLSRALRTLPLGIAYSVWTGIGTVGTVLVGVLMLGETMSLAQMLCVGCVVVGIVGLRALT